MQVLPTIITPTDAKTYVDDQLATYFTKRLTDSAPLGASYTQLWRSIESLVMAGGKRFRPYMLLSAYQAYEPTGDLEEALPAALSQELLHQAMLIHDDIIDRDTTRYGIPNIDGQYQSHYLPYLEDSEERHHMSISAALLAGDVLISDAHRLLSSTKKPQNVVEQASQILSTAVFEVVGGELLDTEVAFLPKGSITAEIIAKYKTASYSFVSPLTMGAILAQAPAQEVTILKELSLHLGIGYQLRDDLLGVFGDETKTGKSTSTDITEGKRTYLVEQFDQLATDEQKSLFYSAFHSLDASDEAISQCKQLLVASGARSAVEAEIERHREATEAIIETLSVSAQSKEGFHTLVAKCLSREV